MYTKAYNLITKLKSKSTPEDQVINLSLLSKIRNSLKNLIGEKHLNLGFEIDQILYLEDCLWVIKFSIQELYFSTSFIQASLKTSFPTQLTLPKTQRNLSISSNRSYFEIQIGLISFRNLVNSEGLFISMRKVYIQHNYSAFNEKTCPHFVQSTTTLVSMWNSEFDVIRLISMWKSGFLIIILSSIIKSN
jgi:hypothetical protein